jgi:hypothetical protein
LYKELYLKMSIAAIRGDSMDDFDGFWLTEVNVVSNKNDGLNSLLKTREEKMNDAIEKGMAAVRANYSKVHYTERYVLPNHDDFMIGSPFSWPEEKFRPVWETSSCMKKQPKVKKRTMRWACFAPSVKF